MQVFEYAVTAEAEEAHQLPPARPVLAAEGAHRLPPARPVLAAEEAHRTGPTGRGGIPITASWTSHSDRGGTPTTRERFRSGLRSSTGIGHFHLRQKRNQRRNKLKRLKCVPRLCRKGQKIRRENGTMYGHIFVYVIIFFGILLPPICKIYYVNMQLDYVNMRVN